MIKSCPVLPSPLSVYLMQQSHTRWGRVSVPTIRYRCRRISVRPRSPSNRTNPPRTLSCPFAIAGRPSFPFLLSRPSGVIPSIGEQNQYAERIGKPVRNMSKDDGRPPVHTFGTSHTPIFWFGTPFVTFSNPHPLPTPRPRSSQLSRRPQVVNRQRRGQSLTL
ncbi:hypothetical protein LZ30DRAFT_103808 [Colletotrichum cereale]|nr:hypothetical protein LZ30DRAFT_103808 [Colletotrichum cereale]